jgi:hypothetical protein
MKHNEFKIGREFICGEQRWCCTDIGTRVIVAICLDSVEVTIHCKEGPPRKETLLRHEAEADGWFNGPPYAVAETVFDENDMEACEPVEEP